MKKLTVLNIIAINFFTFQNLAYAREIATQDLFLIDSIGVTSEGSAIQLIDEVITEALSSSSNSIDFPGGGKFTTTTAFGKTPATDIDSIILENTSVIPGVFSFGSSQVLAILVSSDVSQNKTTIGTSGAIELDLTSIFPVDLKPGDGGVTNYGIVQLLKPSNTTTEEGLSPLEIAVSRVNADLDRYPSINGTNFLVGEQIPFTIAQGSKAGRLFGKGAQVCGAVITGALEYGCAGATLGLGVGAVAGGLPSAGIGAGPGALIGAGIGGAVGGIGGGIGAGLTSAGEAIERNNEDNDNQKTREIPPDSLRPSSSQAQAVPEPLTILGTGVVLGAIPVLKKEYAKRNKKKDKDA